MKRVTEAELAKELREKYIKNPPEGMTSEEVRTMSDDDLLDMDYFLHEFDDEFDDEIGAEVGAGIKNVIAIASGIMFYTFFRWLGMVLGYPIQWLFFKKKVYVILMDEIANNDVPYDKVPWWIDIQSQQCINIANNNDFGLVTTEILKAIGMQFHNACLNRRNCLFRLFRFFRLFRL